MPNIDGVQISLSLDSVLFSLNDARRAYVFQLEDEFNEEEFSEWEKKYLEKEWREWNYSSDDAAVSVQCLITLPSTVLYRRIFILRARRRSTAILSKLNYVSKTRTFTSRAMHHGSRTASWKWYHAQLSSYSVTTVVCRSVYQGPRSRGRGLMPPK